MERRQICSFGQGGAVKLGNVDNTRAVSTEPTDFDTGYVLQDNVMRGVAVEFRGAAAVFAGYVASTQIVHNSISDTGYTGISLVPHSSARTLQAATRTSTPSHACSVPADGRAGAGARTSRARRHSPPTT